MDPETLWHGVGGGALIAAGLTLARLLVDMAVRGAERRFEREERRRAHQRDAEARLERVLQDRLSEADRRLERCEQDAQAARVRAALLEHEHAELAQAHATLREEYAALQAQYARLARKQRVPQAGGADPARGPGG